MKPTCAPGDAYASRFLVSLLLALAMLPGALKGETAPATAPAATSPAPLTIAILDFSAEDSANPQLGGQISQTLTATLSNEPGFTLVERAALARTLQEHELNLTGLVKPEEAIKIGHLVGAKILVTGTAFSIDKSIFITAKLIGTETSRVSGVLVKGKIDADMGDLLTQLSEKVVSRLHEIGPSLVADTTSPPDPLIALKAKLATRKLPKVAIIASDQHIGQSSVRLADPPVDNALRTLLTDAGFTVIDNDSPSLEKAGVGWLIKAQGFSEYAARIGNLATCTGRVELSVVNFSDDKTLFSDSAIARVTDLSENIAGKTALQNAARELGIRFLQKLADTLPPAAK